MVDIRTNDELINLGLSEGMPEHVAMELRYVDIAASEGAALTLKHKILKLRWIVTDGNRYYVCNPRTADAMVAYLGGLGFHHR